MEIFINNIGLVSKADIKADGITVIGGYNNSGKSTILKAVYALLYSNSGINENVLKERSGSLDDMFFRSSILLDLNYSYADMQDLKKLIWDKYYVQKEFLSQEEFLSIIKELAKREKKMLTGMQEKPLLQHIPEINIDMVSELYIKVKAVFERSNSEYERFIFAKNFRNVFFGRISMYNKNKCNVEVKMDSNASFAEFNENKLLLFKKFPIYNMPVFYLSTSHFTENRGTIIYGELNKALKKEDGLDIVYETYNDIEENRETLREILQEILHGSINFSDGGMVCRDEEASQVFNIGNVASGMKNLLVIQRLLSNGSLGRNSILLIDEPETNLHPEWQVKFAEILVLLNKELGIKVIINSHSPYFMRAVEVKMSDYGIKERGHFYLMGEDGKGAFCTEDVTDNTDRIYKMLYKPLEYL